MNIRTSSLLVVLSAIGALFVNLAFAKDLNQQGNAKTSIAPVMKFGDEPVKVARGSSTLTRNGAGISFTLNTDQLGDRYAYTVWWIVFNKPQNCTDGVCNDDDVCSEAAGNSVLWATGRVSDMWGQATFMAHLANDGELPGELLCGAGLTNKNAEVHVLVRSHGPAANLTPKQLEAALSTFEGACDVNTCEDVQFAVHRP
jgi:hypothetical protein